MGSKNPIEGRSKKQIDLILSWYFTYDVVALICGVVCFVTIFFAFAPGPLWSKIVFPCAFAVPVIIRSILTIKLKTKLYQNETVTISVKNPRAKVVRTRQGGDAYHLKGLRITGEVDGRVVSFFEYPLKESSTAFFREEKRINNLVTIELRVVKGTHVIDNFYQERKRKAKNAVSTYKNFTTGKEREFKFAPMEIEKEDLSLFLGLFSLYEELYLLGPSESYVVVKLSVSGKEEERYLTIDKTAIDDVDKTMEWLENNGFIVDGVAKLLAIMDMNDPSGFFAELSGLK
ncbi:MAG: hypothetical protein IJS37_01210 [Bacilli bacterium]|nr:hypothetical protein [Bacilli bacterium]